MAKTEGIGSRWYPKISTATRYMITLRGQIDFRCDDGLKVIHNSLSARCHLYQDPPYPAGGKKRAYGLTDITTKSRQTLANCQSLAGDFSDDVDEPRKSNHCTPLASNSLIPIKYSSCTKKEWSRQKFIWLDELPTIHDLKPITPPGQSSNATVPNALRRALRQLPPTCARHTTTPPHPHRSTQRRCYCSAASHSLQNLSPPSPRPNSSSNCISARSKRSLQQQQPLHKVDYPPLKSIQERTAIHRVSLLERRQRAASPNAHLTVRHV
jgi:hypothetical protein